MGHDKLRKFAENETFTCLLQPSSAEILADGYFSLRDHKIKGRWNAEMFDAPRPIVLELGCGKGEYTIALAERDPSRNYIGVDIKGARLWKGAKYAESRHLGNVAFLRTRIELISAFFAPGEVDEIWLTFSDPQIRRENARLTCPLFLERYSRLLRPGGIIHLKTDSRFLHEYTKAVCRQNGLELIACTEDLYGEGDAGAGMGGRNLPDAEAGLKGPAVAGTGLGCVNLPEGSIPPEAREVQTFYETLFRSQGYRINYIAFRLGCPGAGTTPDGSQAAAAVDVTAGRLFQSPDRELFDPDYWRSIEGERQIFGHDTAETRRQKLKRQQSEK